MPKVSVIIPVYNAHDYLERCLDSVVNQTLQDIEIICVDDCSTDDSLAILNKYASLYPQIKVIHHEQNGGESKARNTGIDAATGEYLAFVDNDDTVDLDFYEKLYNKATQEKADIAKGEVRIYEYDGQITYGTLSQELKQSGDKYYFAYHWWTAIYKASLIKENKIYLPEGYPLGGDVLFLNKALIKANKVAVVDGTFYNYYRRENSGDSKVLSIEKIKSALDIFEMIFKNIKATGFVSDGVKFNVTSWMIQILYYPFRVKEESSLKYILQKAIEFYEKSENYIQITSMSLFVVVIDLLKQKDLNGLFHFYQKNNSLQKMFIANLRYSHRKGISHEE